jgi:alkylation response protein AidB-like acyl-CoA dehydrogenase
VTDELSVVELGIAEVGVVRFLLSDEQRQFAASLHDLLAASDVPDVVRRWSDGDSAPGLALWRRLAELGVTGLTVPESCGGLEAHPVDLVVAFEELGGHAVPGPLVESIAVVPALLAGHTSDRLSGIASGSVLATVAMAPRVPRALDADVADVVLTVDHGVLCDARIDGPPLTSVDGARRLFTVTPTVGLGRCGPAAAGRAFDLGVLACSAQLLGAGRALVDMAAAHARQRVQFGRPIGAFQAVKHLLADAYVDVEMARPLLHGAAVGTGAGADTARRDVSAAKVACGAAAYRAARTALQVHGAIGYTAEHDVGLLLRKVRALVSAWGTASQHRGHVMAELARGRESTCTSR